MTDWLCSIHQRHWTAIADGSKRYELRRRVPNIAAGERVYVYVTRPIGCVLGSFVTGGVLRCVDVDALWSSVHGATPTTTREDVDAYFDGCPRPSAIAVCDVRLETRRLAKHPPQGLVRVTPETFA